MISFGGHVKAGLFGEFAAVFALYLSLVVVQRSGSVAVWLVVACVLGDGAYY